MGIKVQFIGWAGRLLFIMALGLLMAPVSSCALEKDAASISTLEKRMAADSTKKIQYRRGKVRSQAASSWKRAKKIAKTADHLTIRRKGWYTLCVTRKSGKRKLIRLYFYKKKYEIPMNQVLSPQEGYYYLIPKAEQRWTVEVKNASLSNGTNLSARTRADCAGQVWKMETAGGKKFRLKNVNSGLYLSCKRKKGKYQAVQTKYAAKKKEQIFSLYDGNYGFTYIKCRGTKQYLQLEENNLQFTSRKRQKAWKFKWQKTECPASYAMITGATYPTSLLTGNSFTLKGTVISRYAITVFSAGVYDKAGRAVLHKSVIPDSCIADLKQLDAAITFGKLPAGTYTYKVAVRDATGKDILLINRMFTVGAFSGVGSKILSYDSSLIIRIGHQSNGTALEKKACASYALAYCNAILTGTVTSPHSYWSSPANVDCVWSKGGYTTQSYTSEQAVLQAAYSQLVAGKPCILHVTGNTAQHWLTIIGCKKTTAFANFSAADFIAIDPWDGRVITVSDSYQVKTTYRLGVKK